MSAAATLKSTPVNTDHRNGAFLASIIIVEYGDYECPHCAKAAKVLEQLLDSYPDTCLIYRHFPLSEVHQHARLAAVAAEAAGKQNKFWEMHQALFLHQDDLSSESIFTIAREVGLNMREFLNDLEDEDMLEKVNENFSSGIQSSVASTPTLFINGVRFEGSISEMDLKAELDEILRYDQPNA